MKKLLSISLLVLTHIFNTHAMFIDGRIEPKIIRACLDHIADELQKQVDDPKRDEVYFTTFFFQSYPPRTQGKWDPVFHHIAPHIDNKVVEMVKANRRVSIHLSDKVICEVRDWDEAKNGDPVFQYHLSASCFKGHAREALEERKKAQDQQ